MSAVFFCMLWSGRANPPEMWSGGSVRGRKGRGASCLKYCVVVGALFAFFAPVVDPFSHNHN